MVGRSVAPFACNLAGGALFQDSRLLLLIWLLLQSKIQAELDQRAQELTNAVKQLSESGLEEDGSADDGGNKLTVSQCFKGCVLACSTMFWVFRLTDVFYTGALLFLLFFESQGRTQRRVV